MGLGIKVFLQHSTEEQIDKLKS